MTDIVRQEYLLEKERENNRNRLKQERWIKKGQRVLDDVEDRLKEFRCLECKKRTKLFKQKGGLVIFNSDCLLQEIWGIKQALVYLVLQ